MVIVQLYSYEGIGKIYTYIHNTGVQVHVVGDTVYVWNTIYVNLIAVIS